MNLALNKKMPRVVLLLAVGLLAVSLSGCSLDQRTVETGVSQNELSAGGEPYFNVGPVTYQIQVSRQINPFDPVDVQYFAGVQDAQTLPGNQFWYGVFLWAKNQTSVDRKTTDSFKLVDSSGRVFLPTQLNASINPYAWSAQTLSPDGIEPLAGTTASNGSTGGGLVLFQLPQDVYSNRPLTLLIYPYGSTKPSRVSLDL